MKGEIYYSWFSDEEAVNWKHNLLNDRDGDFDYYMETEFPDYTTFFFLAFNLERSREGDVYWSELYYKYREYETLEPKIGFDYQKRLTQPKIF